jgi:hypothetical protein
MNPLDTVRRGLIAAVPVCLVAVAIILLRADAIESTANDSPVELGGATDIGWIGTWTIITLAFGVVATAAHDYLTQRWGWTGAEYLSFALSLAVALSAVAFLKIYAGEMHPYRIEYSALNFAYAFGFGCAVPVLAGGATEREPTAAGRNQAPQ